VKLKPAFGLTSLAPMSLALLGACATPMQTSSERLYEFMSDSDVRTANETLDRALETLPSGASIGWSNPSNGHSGSVRPVQTAFVPARNTYCRDYEETLTIGRRTDRYRDTACRNSQGQWIPIER
jgi:surface antigen